MTDTVKRIEEEVVIIEDGKRFRIWVEEERGEWVPDSFENKGVSEETGEDWDFLSENDYRKNNENSKKGCSSSDSELVAQKITDTVDMDVSGTGVLSATEGGEAQQPANQIKNSNVDGSTIKENRYMEKSGTDTSDLPRNMENINGKEHNSRLDGGLEGVWGKEPNFNLFDYQEELWISSRQKESGDGDDSQVLKNFKVNLDKDGLGKGIKKYRRPKTNNKNSTMEEVDGLIRPRKRMRNNDPFNLNEIIGIQEDSSNTPDQEEGDGNILEKDVGGENYEEETSSRKKDLMEKVLDDLNLQPNEEEEENMALEINVTSIMGDKLGLIYRIMNL
ncbi:uncharacterized protein LOC110914931 [Helianthus annuus]|uniref:uncharacterized protein LOC110914931 n=1 Tax=Helianthus annuus TaxID=4232 RepID=UPI000B8F1389|nr:uncharacterized protein LOC110914931 [Helianthus annuus]